MDMASMLLSIGVIGFVFIGGVSLIIYLEERFKK